MLLVPYYRTNSSILLGFKEDFKDRPLDGLIIKVNIERKTIDCPPWSLQKMLKFDPSDPVTEAEKELLMEEIRTALGPEKILEIEQSLENPPQSSIKTLIWIPDRLKESI